MKSILDPSFKFSSLEAAMFRNPVTPSSWPIFCKVSPVRNRNHVIKSERVMELDLKNADTLVELVIAKRCSTYGPVASVEVHREPTPFAPVEMSRREHTEDVASHCQGSVFGNAALVRLEHKGE